MFEKEVENIKQKVLSKVSGRDRISLNEIIAWDIPQAMKDYFNIFAERILSEELLNVLYSKRFDQNNSDFISVRKTLINTLKNALLFTYSEFEDALDKASKFALNFVLRPEWTLAKVIFKNEPVKTIEQINETISNFNEYSYYKNLMVKILEKYQSNEIKFEIFQRMLRKIDEEVVKNVSIKELLSIVEPVFDFFKFANDSVSVPAEALMIYYSDKGLENIVKEIELEKDLHRRQKLTPADLEIILKRVLKPASLKEEAPAYTEEQSPEVRIETPEVQPKEPVEEIETIEIGSAPGIKLLDLNSLLDEKRKEKFVKKIFKRDERRFYEAINKLNSINNWKEASAFIDSIFIEHEIDPYSDEAVEFTDFVYRRYFPAMR